MIDSSPMTHGSGNAFLPNILLLFCLLLLSGFAWIVSNRGGPFCFDPRSDDLSSRHHKRVGCCLGTIFLPRCAAEIGETLDHWEWILLEPIFGNPEPSCTGTGGCDAVLSRPEEERTKEQTNANADPSLKCFQLFAFAVPPRHSKA